MPPLVRYTTHHHHRSGPSQRNRSNFPVWLLFARPADCPCSRKLTSCTALRTAQLMPPRRPTPRRSAKRARYLLATTTTTTTTTTCAAAGSRCTSKARVPTCSRATAPITSLRGSRWRSRRPASPCPRSHTCVCEPHPTHHRRHDGSFFLPHFLRCACCCGDAMPMCSPCSRIAADVMFDPAAGFSSARTMCHLETVSGERHPITHPHPHPTPDTRHPTSIEAARLLFGCLQRALLAGVWYT